MKKTVLVVGLILITCGAAVGSGADARRPWLDPESGEPFFPLGWYEWENGCIGRPTGRQALADAKSSLDEMAAEGANTVNFHNTWQWAQDDAELTANLGLWQEYLDYAQDKDVKIIAFVDAKGWTELLEEQGRAAMRRLRRLIKVLSQHPALLGYNISDEPECRAEPVEPLGRIRRLIERWDANPDHLVQVVFNHVPYEDYSPQDWKEYLPVLDTFQVDRYPICRQFSYFSHSAGDPGAWGSGRCAWEFSHAVAAIENSAHRNPVIVLQGMGKNYYEGGYHWRDPLYEETRYMAYSSLTAGAWGVVHWIRNISPPNIRCNVARLYAELRQLLPAFKHSWQSPPFTVSHNHEQITRDWLTDRLADITTLALADDANYYLIAANNTGVFEDVRFRLQLPVEGKDGQGPRIQVLNEDWVRNISFDAEAGDWVIDKHTMCFGDVNIWVLPKDEL